MSNIYVIDKISLEKSSSVMKETSSLLLRYRNTKSKDLCLNFILSPFATPRDLFQFLWHKTLLTTNW